MLAVSLAPSIYGHEMIKRALVLQQAGGVGKILDNKTRLRGDINVLLVGDPGVAKSQLLRAISNLAINSVLTTGRGSTGAGLTAAVTQNKDTGERQLEAGAVVLADRGIVLIDEFDKMSDIDRVAIHEVMEQQTVTITKAGTHTVLNARCSVLSSSNPLYGSYDSCLTVQRNINLPDSLLSRFDILYVMADHSTNYLDRKIATHVLATRSFAKNLLINDTINSDIRDHFTISREVTDITIDNIIMDHEKKFYLYDKGYYHLSNNQMPILNSIFLQKFFSYMRIRPIEPSLITPMAQEKIIKFYSQLRNAQRSESGLPITARTLETIIRISTANAKLCLDCKKITENDVLVAEIILRAALLGEIWNPIKKKSIHQKKFKDQLKTEKKYCNNK